ncbi:lamin tail domain-containing protein, partial [Candidatus Poribacteria bacterium]
MKNVICVLVCFTLVLLFLVISPTQADGGGIVINEIMYHPPNDLEAEEYVELYNSGGTPVDLSGWKFTKGISYTFPEGTTIRPDNYLVICRSMNGFRAAYGRGGKVLGDFAGRL